MTDQHTSRTSTHTCDGSTDPEVPAYRRAARAWLRAAVAAALATGPGTASEIRDRIESRPWRSVYWCGERGCQFLGPTHVSTPAQGDVQRELVRLQRNGIADRLIIPGWKAHLWWAAP
jgi:hypothetical protein